MLREKLLLQLQMDGISLATNAYWTSSASSYDSNSAWTIINDYPRLHDVDVGISGYGVRPVLDVSK